MKIVKSLLTKNDCYKKGIKITVKGLMLHSVGCSQPNASAFINQWNTSGVSKCVHGFIEENGTVYQTLPFNYKGWHCASGAKGSGNNTHLGFEMTEPSTIKYTGTGSQFTDLDPTKTKAFVKGTYNTAVELFAKLCKDYNLNPLGDGVIISHSEGCTRGIASNHGDVEHVWKKYGLTMNQFRKDVKAKMVANATPVKTTTTATTSKTTYKVQCGAYSVKANATNLYNKIKKAGFDAFIVKDGSLYKVQCGAYSVKANASQLVTDLKKKGFTAIIVEIK